MLVFFESFTVLLTPRNGNIDNVLHKKHWDSTSSSTIHLRWFVTLRLCFSISTDADINIVISCGVWRPLKILRMQPVVAIHKADPFAASVAKAQLIPAFRAADKPSFSWWITCMRLSFATYSSQMAGQLTGLPSSTRLFWHLCMLQIILIPKTP